VAFRGQISLESSSSVFTIPRQNKFPELSGNNSQTFPKLVHGDLRIIGFSRKVATTVYVAGN